MSTVPVKRHGVDGVLVAVDDVDALPLGDVPHNDEVVVAGREEDVFGRGMPLEVHDAAPASKMKTRFLSVFLSVEVACWHMVALMMYDYLSWAWSANIVDVLE